MSTAVLAPVAPTVAKLIRLLSSDHDHEVLAAARALDRVLHGAGLDLHVLADTIEVPANVRTADWRSLAKFCADQAWQLTERELDFIATLGRWRGTPTERQLTWLRAIADRLRT